MKDELIIKLYDWDAVGTPDKLGQARINLASLEPIEATNIRVPLAIPGSPPKGEVMLRLLFRPQFIVKTRAATSTFSGANRVATGVGSGVTQVGKGAAIFSI